MWPDSSTSEGVGSGCSARAAVGSPGLPHASGALAGSLAEPVAQPSEEWGGVVFGPPVQLPYATNRPGPLPEGEAPPQDGTEGGEHIGLEHPLAAGLKLRGRGTLT